MAQHQGIHIEGQGPPIGPGLQQAADLVDSEAVLVEYGRAVRALSNGTWFFPRERGGDSVSTVSRCFSFILFWGEGSVGKEGLVVLLVV